MKFNLRKGFVIAALCIAAAQAASVWYASSSAQNNGVILCSDIDRQQINI